MHKYSNKLIHETSPYLLQHAHNPVDWYPWGEEALGRAKAENKPILVSIGYSACHWCHVMEKESFENEETAAMMNEHFINIKIDREERPDLDQVYMDAVQAMSGSGGWPLNVFLTPDTKPFFGGTYFPPVKAYNRASWKDVLLGVNNAFLEKRDEIENQAENLINHLVQANSFGLTYVEGEVIFKKEKLKEAFQNIMKSADKEWGGFGKAPKFPQTQVIKFLLRYHYLFEDKEAKDQATLSLDKMIDGGIYDQLGGGFARYSTDAEWLAPHFEKMLYDNALLIAVLSEAYQLTKNKKYSDVIEEIISFIQREMMHPDGGFYAAIDADSEGEEGRFYVWSFEEVSEILKEDAGIFCDFFDVTPGGNWEGKNILWKKNTEANYCRENSITIEKLGEVVSKGKEKLLAARSKRIRPQLDDKILLSWNCLMNSALSQAYAATGNSTYRDIATKNMQFVLKSFSTGKENTFFHTWKNEEAKHPAFLDDYAYLVQALIALQEINGDKNYLVLAKELSEYVIKNFIEEKTGFFFYTSLVQKDILLRKKEVYDGAQPSGNAVMADNLYRLSLYFDLPKWNKISKTVVSSLGNAIVKYPTSFGAWSCLLQEMVGGTSEIAIVKSNSEELHVNVLNQYIPHKILMVTAIPDDDFPLLSGKKTGEEESIYLCSNYACHKPVSTVKELMVLLRG